MVSFTILSCFNFKIKLRLTWYIKQEKNVWNVYHIKNGDKVVINHKFPSSRCEQTENETVNVRADMLGFNDGADDPSVRPRCPPGFITSNSVGIKKAD